VGGMGGRCGWHEDGVPRPDGVDALEGLVVLGDEPVTEEGEVRRRRWPPGACKQ
jgi:hypothetical protein